MQGQCEGQAAPCRPERPQPCPAAGREAGGSDLAGPCCPVAVAGRRSCVGGAVWESGPPPSPLARTDTHLPFTPRVSHGRLGLLQARASSRGFTSCRIRGPLMWSGERHPPPVQRRKRPREGERPSPGHPAGYGRAWLPTSHTGALSTAQHSCVWPGHLRGTAGSPGSQAEVPRAPSGPCLLPFRRDDPPTAQCHGRTEPGPCWSASVPGSLPESSAGGDMCTGPPWPWAGWLRPASSPM